jgi:hypothetical protein
MSGSANTSRRGGPGRGQGRKRRDVPGPFAQKSVVLSQRAWACIRLYALQWNCTDNVALERLVRSHLLFVEEAHDLRAALADALMALEEKERS